MTRREFIPAIPLTAMSAAAFVYSPVRFRDIERLENGKWMRADFNNLHKDDIFRFMDDIQNPFKCLDHAYPLTDVPGNYGVNCEKLNRGVV